MNEKSETGLHTVASEAEGESPPAKESRFSFLAFLLLVVLASLAVRSFGFSLFNIPSESMMSRLMVGDYLVATKFDYGISRYSLPGSPPIGSGRFLPSEPERGDVVIFKHPIDGHDYVKRVIGLPGDSVAMEGGRVVLNGEVVPQQRIGDFVVKVSPNTRCAWGADEERNSDGTLQCRYSAYRETLPSGKSYEVLDFGPTFQDGWGPRVVPDGTLFVLGDNRDNSQDSRFAPESNGGVGFVPQGLLVGKARRIIWSTDGSAEWLKPWTWFTAARDGRMGEPI